MTGAIIRLLHAAGRPRLAPGEELDGVGYGFLIPVFFVVSGMGIDSRRSWWTRFGVTLFVFVSILLIRGGSVYAMFRHLDGRSRLTLGLFSATGLPIIVAVTTVAVESGHMGREEQSIVVAAGMLTVLCLPVLALGLHTAPKPARPARRQAAPRDRRRMAEDRGFEPLRAVNPTRFPSERHRPLGESSAEEATGESVGPRNRSAALDFVRRTTVA